MEGYTCQKDGYFGPKGRVLRAGHPGSDHCWVYALAFRLSGDAYLWEMARNIARGNGWGEIGEAPGGKPDLRIPDDSSDPRLLFALLELHRAKGHAAFLDAAEKIGRNILGRRIRNGWFVPSQRHVYCRLANDESQALLHLTAALMGQAKSMPAFTGAEPFFHAEYGTSKGRVYDSADIYGKLRPGTGKENLNSAKQTSLRRGRAQPPQAHAHHLATVVGLCGRAAEIECLGAFTKCPPTWTRS